MRRWTTSSAIGIRSEPTLTSSQLSRTKSCPRSVLRYLRRRDSRTNNHRPVLFFLWNIHHLLTPSHSLGCLYFIRHNTRRTISVAFNSSSQRDIHPNSALRMVRLRRSRVVYAMPLLYMKMLFKPIRHHCYKKLTAYIPE